MPPFQDHDHRLRPAFGELVRARLDELAELGYDTSPRMIAAHISHYLALQLGPEAGYYRHEYISRVTRGELGPAHLTPERVDAYAHALIDNLPESKIPGGFDRARLHYAVYDPPGVSLEQYRRAFRPLEAVAS